MVSWHAAIYSAVSEYKWVRLQNGGSLSLLDVYDACTRGVGGTTIESWK